MVLADPMAQCMTTEIWEELRDGLPGEAPRTDKDNLTFDGVRLSFHQARR